MSVQASVPVTKTPNIRSSRYYTPDRVAFNIVGYILVGLFGLVCFVPFYLVVVASFTSEAEVMKYGYGLFFRDFSLEGYFLSLKNPALILRAYANTIGITVIGTFFATMMATMTGYVLQRVDFPWRNKFSFFFFFTTLFKRRSGSLVSPLHAGPLVQESLLGACPSGHVLGLEHDHRQELHEVDPA